MQQYIIRRLILNVLVLFLVATMVFLALRIDPSNVISTRAQGCTVAETYDECYQIAKQELGLDEPILVQYQDFMTGLLQGDLGDSWRERGPVREEIKERIPPSVELGLLQVLVAVVVAIPVGVISAIRQDTWIDYILRFFSIAMLGIPVFVLAIFTIMAASRWFEGTFFADWMSPQGQYYDFWDPFNWTPYPSDPVKNLQIMFAPAVLGGLATGATIMRFLRSQMLEVMRQDYVRTAWAKGLKERVVIIRHTLKNALIPVLTLIGILLGTIVSGNVILENIYRIPGIGFYVTSAISQAPDFPVVQGVVIVVAITIVFVNLLVDVMYGWLDPRIRYS
jgi:peptide/nickel transport system permease protein